MLRHAARSELPATGAAFDALASRYDELWTGSLLGSLQRQQVLRELDRLFRRGEQILELGCGTGEDALHLAQGGVRIHAIDASPEMLGIASRKLEGFSSLVTLELCAIEDIQRLRSRGPFDGCFSNFGALNCLADPGSLAAGLARLLRPGARLALCFMGRFCLWETVWYLAHGRPAKAFRRLRRDPVKVHFQTGTGAGEASTRDFPIQYPAVAELIAAFAPDFELESVRGVGSFVPPSYMEHWARRRTGLLRIFERLDTRLAKRPPFRGLADHRLVTFTRAASAPEPASSGSVVVRLRCPACSSCLDTGLGDARCGACGHVLEVRDGVLRAITPQRQEYYTQFRKEYTAVRRTEGRGSEHRDYYLALPYRDLTGRNSNQWSIRARTYQYFVRRVLPSLEGEGPLLALDMGAGNGWLSYRLALRGHRPVAIDLRDDSTDGLAAAKHFDSVLRESFPRVEAEFDDLPFCDAQFDLAVFNASLHYSTDYIRTLTEVRRCLRPGGAVVVLDSPIYRLKEHGERMREERHREFEARHGFRSDSVPSREFLYDGELRELTHALAIRWTAYRPWYGLRWHLRPWKARLAGRRPPSRFNILVGRWEA